MIRTSTLRNMPVICCKKQIGLLQSITLDTAQKRVQALVVSCGMRGKRMVLREHVQAIADGFILTDRIERMRRMDEQTPSRFVRDTTGMLAGYITDYAVDERTLEVLAVEVMPGYWPSESRKRIWVSDYGGMNEPQGDLIVPVSSLQRADCFEGGNLTCAYPP